MAQVLRHLPPITDPNLLVGSNTSDDSAVYKLDDGTALVQTVDFFPPIVDDPYSFGAIAAANSLSDIYAMGARPLIGLNLVCFPIGLSKDILVEILKGGADKMAEAGAIIAGGHTIDDDEPKYGLAITGLVVPGEQVANVGARSGDQLVLTKPIGTGIITTALKAGKADREIEKRAVAVMSALNKAAAEAMVRVGVNACTDITGFGLLGHLREMTRGSGAGARIYLSRVPTIPGLWPLAQDGIAPGGSRRNLESLRDAVVWENGISREARMVLADAQTSGGLLMAVAPDKAERLMDALVDVGVEGAAIIGEVVEDPQGGIRVAP